LTLTLLWVVLEHLKEDAWNLELAKQELGNSMAELQHSLSKSVTDQNKMSKQLTSLTQEVEVLRSTEEKLTSQVETMKTRHEQDMNTMRKHSSTLQREKNEVAKQLETTAAELVAVRSLSKSNRKSITDADLAGNGDGANTNGSDDEVNGKQHGHSPNTSPPPSPTHAPRNTALELETLKTSLSHAHRMISNLRSSLHKEKQDRFELKKHLADSQETIEQLRNGSHMWADVGADRASGSGYGAGEGAASSLSASGRRLKKAGNKKRAPARRAKGLTPRRPSDDEEYEDIDELEILNSDNSEDDFEDHPDDLHRRFDSSGGLSETSDSDSIHTLDAKASLGLAQANFVPLSSELSGSKNYNPGVDMGVNTDPVVFVSDSIPAEQPKVIHVDTGVNTDVIDTPLTSAPAFNGLSAVAGLAAGGLAAHELTKHDGANAAASSPAQASEPGVTDKSIISPIEQEQTAVVEQAAAQGLNDKASANFALPITEDPTSAPVATATAHKTDEHTEAPEDAQMIDGTVEAQSALPSAVESNDKAVAQPEETQSVVSTLASPEVVNNTFVASDEHKGANDVMNASAGMHTSLILCFPHPSVSNFFILTATALVDGAIGTTAAGLASAELPESDANVATSTVAPTDDVATAQVVESKPLLVDAATQTVPDNTPSSERDDVATALPIPISADVAADQETEGKPIPIDHAASPENADIPSSDVLAITALAAGVAGAYALADNKSTPLDTTADEALSPHQVVSSPVNGYTPSGDAVPDQHYDDSAAMTSSAIAAEQMAPNVAPGVDEANMKSGDLTEGGKDVDGFGEKSHASIPAIVDQDTATNTATGVPTKQMQQEPVSLPQATRDVSTASDEQSNGPAQNVSSKLVEAAALTGGIVGIGMAEKAAGNHSLSAHPTVAHQEAPVEAITSSADASGEVKPSLRTEEPRQGHAHGHATIFNTTYPPSKLTQKNLAALSASPDGNDITFANKREFDNISRSDVESGSRRASSSIYKPISEKEGYSSTIAPNIVSNITQTMIGGWMYKNTRKAVGSGFSDNRHRRFFWIHPYSRTLYWSMKEPGSNGEAKAKSVNIDSITSVPEHSNSPPGLPTVSLLVKTSTRDIKFTAPDIAQHEIWLQAINYLLARPAGNVLGMSQPRPDPQSMRSNPSILLRKPSYQRIQSVFSSSASNAPSRADSARYAGDGLNDDDLEDLEDVRMCCDGKHHISKLEKHQHHHRSSKQYRPVSGASFDQPFAMSITSGNGSAN
jgi:Meiotic cell cortex C-terminal pleckstrin homology